MTLAKTGATLVCWDINKSDNDKVVKEIRDLGTKAHGYVIDVADRTQVEEISRKVSHTLIIRF